MNGLTLTTQINVFCRLLGALTTPIRQYINGKCEPARKNYHIPSFFGAEHSSSYVRVSINTSSSLQTYAPSQK